MVCDRFWLDIIVPRMMFASWLFTQWHKPRWLAHYQSWLIRSMTTHMNSREFSQPSQESLNSSYYWVYLPSQSITDKLKLFPNLGGNLCELLHVIDFNLENELWFLGWWGQRVEVFKGSNVVRIYRQRKCNTSTFKPCVLYLFCPNIHNWKPRLQDYNGMLRMQM